MTEDRTDILAALEQTHRGILAGKVAVEALGFIAEGDDAASIYAHSMLKVIAEVMASEDEENLITRLRAEGFIDA